MQLMGVVGKGEDFDHRVQDHHNPRNKEEQTHGLKFKLNILKSTEIAFTSEIPI